MLPINMLLKLARTRSHISIFTKSFVTSSTSWKQKEECSDKYKHCPQQSGGDRGIDCQKKRYKEPQKGCCPKDDVPTGTEEQGANKQQKRVSCGSIELDEFLEQSKQGEGSSCGATESTDICQEGKHHQGLSKGAASGTASYIQENHDSGQDLNSRTPCSCPPYDTPKCVKENDTTGKEQKPPSECPEKNVSKCPKEKQKCMPQPKRSDPCERSRITQCQEDQKCAPKRSRSDPREKGQPKCPQEEDMCDNQKIKEHECKSRQPLPIQEDQKCAPKLSRSGPCEKGKPKCSQEENIFNNQKIKGHCEERESYGKGMCSPEVKKCQRGSSQERLKYCGPFESSYNNVNRDGKAVCSKYDEETKNDPCAPACNEEKECSDTERGNDPCQSSEPSSNKCPNQGNQCRESHCGSSKIISKSLCANECESITAKRSCNTPQENDCPKFKEEECLHGDQSCPEDQTKNGIKIPELSPFCKVDAAKECVHKLKELQRQWEEVIASQEGKDKCDSRDGRGRVDNRETGKRECKRSNMIYVILGAILVAVVYCIYNEDFEPEDLFLQDEVVKHDDNDDDEQ